MATEEDGTGDGGLTRKRRVRAAHRGSVTRLTDKLDEILISGDARRLRQLKQSLTDKQHVLSKLDDELIELVNDEHLEEEVEAADLIRERIGLAIISLDDALESLSTRRTPREASSPSRSPLASVEERRLHHDEPSDVRVSSSDPIAHPTTMIHHGPPTSSTVDLRPATTDVTTSPWTASSGVTPLPPMPLPSLLTMATSTTSPTGAVPSTTVTFSGMFPHTSMPPGSSLPTSVFGSFPGVIPIHTLLPSTSSLAPHRPSIAHGVTSQVKLPKLSIKRFNGDLTKWVTFWDSFSSSIHSNPTLSSVDKFNYLSSLLESSAAEAIAGLTLTAANYNEAIETLKKRFGNPQLIVNRHTEALLNIAAVSSNHDVKGFRRLHDSVEAHVRGLRALGVPATAYGGILSSVLVNKLPPEIRLIISREMTGDGWNLDKVMKIIEREVDAREQASVPTTSRNPRRRMPTAATLIASNSEPTGEHITCVYCGQGHKSSSCTTLTDVTARKEILRRQMLHLPQETSPQQGLPFKTEMREVSRAPPHYDLYTQCRARNQ